MAFKQRYESDELKILRSLDNRMVLSPSDKQHYLNLKKGYEGEVMFDEMTEKLKCECHILNDLLFKVNSSTFQIDSLIIMQGQIHIFEVKNYAGNLIYGDDYFKTEANTEIQNPQHQLNRSEVFLRQLFQIHKIKLPIEAHVVFINPEYTLYQCPLNKPFIFPTQLDRYFQKLNQTPSKLNENHMRLAEKLILMHIKKSPYTQLPLYTYEQQKKGITCFSCDSFSVRVNNRKCVCEDCGYEESVESAVMRNLREMVLLFPEMKVTTNLVHEWCQVIESKKRISRVLEKNMKIVGMGRWAYYVEK